MKRDPLGKLSLLALIAVLAGLALVTRFPDAGWVHRVTKTAIIGPWVERLAELYRKPKFEPPVAAEAWDLEGGVEVVYRMDLGRGEARPTISIQAGTALFAEASKDSGTMASLPETNAELLDRVGDWYQVRHRKDRGWVYLPWSDESSGRPPPPLGSEPAPPLPVPSRAPDPEVLARVTELLGDSKEPQALGPYVLYSDVVDRALLIYVSAIVSRLESAYVSRFGLEPLPGVREAVVLFAFEADYQRLLEGVPEVPKLSTPGFGQAGVVATYSEGRGWSEVAGTVIHELTHLLNRRALGPALPSWLDEGLATDLAQSRIEGLQLLPGTLGGTSVRNGSRIEYTGGQAAAIDVRRAVDAGDLLGLEQLVGLDREAFHSTEGRSLRYGHSLFFVRSLLDSSDSELAAAFRAFLLDVSKGLPISAEALQKRLDRTWEVLDKQLVSYVRGQTVDEPRPASIESGSSSRQASEPSS